MVARHGSGENRLSLSLNWDLLDYLAVLGVVLALAGLVLTLLPATRSGGVLVPAGLAVMAAAAYAARRKDGPTA
jgi:hypothetical protein